MEQHANVSSYLPSPADLLLAIPRLLFKAGSLGEHIDNVFGKLRSGGSIIAEATAANLMITMGDPTIATAGRVVYVTAADNSTKFTLTVNGGGAGNDGRGSDRGGAAPLAVAGSCR